MEIDNDEMQIYFERQKIRKLLENCNEPLIFKGALKWKVAKYSLDDWLKLLKNEVMPFRCGKKVFTKEPQWERTTKIKHMLFEDFTKENDKEWMYFDYKYLSTWLNNIDIFQKDITWEDFGFPEEGFGNSTMWIGSKGAHTPCHADSYGCNLIAQVFGKKLWVVFPPKEDLNPTRVPYEESSIFSKLNFYSPNLEDFENAGNNGRRIILEPGDVLFLPHKWWHYVENLELAISVNMWFNSSEDAESHVEEALVQFFASHVSCKVNPRIREFILNPNSEEDCDRDFNQSMEIIKLTTERCKERCGGNKIPESLNVDEVINKYHYIHKIPKMTREEFKNFLEDQSNRFDCGEINVQVSREEETVNFFEAVTHPDVISLMKEKIVQKFK